MAENRTNERQQSTKANKFTADNRKRIIAVDKAKFEFTW
jgi:hypothetical protein